VSAGNQKERIILGIDPGTNVLGYGVIKETEGGLKLLALGSVKFDAKDDSLMKLRHILKAVEQLLDNHLPDEVAVESPFYGNNIQSMLKLGRAQGVAIATALARGIPVQEYAPTRIKQAITGKGSCSKEQVAGMAAHILSAQIPANSLDATDAVGVAICHALSTGTGKSKSPKAKSAGNWQEFLSKNPGRVRKP
jgi:crossover junction endodeoxyribonuclease RuvC